MSDQPRQTKKSQVRRGWFRRSVVKLLIVLAAIAVVAGVSAVPPRDRETAPGEAAPVNVRVMQVAAVPELADTFVLPGVIEPNRVVTIAAEVAARVERVPLKEGDRVEAGNLLVGLNRDLMEPQYRTAVAQYERNRIEYERMEVLVKDNAASRQDLDNATTQLAASQAALEEAQARLERTRIVAPAGGVLNKLLVEKGEYVSAGTAVAVVVEMDPVKVSVNVPERDIAFFDVGDQAQITATAKDRQWLLTGTITYIDELADPQTRTTLMEIVTDNPEGRLRSGQIVRVRLTRRVFKNAIMIPLAAVIPMESSYAVYVAEDGQAQRQIVTLGIIRGDNVQIVDGLEAGQELIVTGHRFVAPGQQINIVPED